MSTPARPADALFAMLPEGPVSCARFRAEVRQLSRQLATDFAGHRHILNLCEDRYRFIVGFAASLVSGRVTLLPSSQTPESLRQLHAMAPDCLCLHDGHAEGIDLPTLRFPPFAGITVSEGEGDDAADSADSVAAIPPGQLAACVFTSGSTGTPVAHRKTWGSLVNNAAAAVSQLDLGAQPHSIVATVPPQHMYGFESTVLLSLLGGCPVWSGRPFYPADIAAALAAMPRPRLLVTTPFHLRTLLDAGIALPPVDRILSATAPLSPELAQRAESILGAPLLEIYGCTETGQIARRRLALAAAWQLLDGIELRNVDGETRASGGHIEGEVTLHDVIELLPQRRFALHGRQSDLINIAGKRTSLAYLNQQLLAIAGVEDGCFFMPDEPAGSDITRLCALVVAPTLTVRQLRTAMRQRIDAVFLPRPLIRLNALPRNAAGKLTRSSLAAALAAHGANAAQAEQAAPPADRNTPHLTPATP